MWHQQQVNDFIEKLLIFLSFFGFLCKWCVCIWDLVYVCVHGKCSVAVCIIA